MLVRSVFMHSFATQPWRAAGRVFVRVRRSRRRAASMPTAISTVNGSPGLLAPTPTRDVAQIRRPPACASARRR